MFQEQLEVSERRSLSVYEAYQRWSDSQTRPSRGYVCLGCEMKDQEIVSLKNNRDCHSDLMHRALERCVESMDSCSEQYTSLESKSEVLPVCSCNFMM